MGKPPEWLTSIGGFLFSGIIGAPLVALGCVRSDEAIYHSGDFWEDWKVNTLIVYGSIFAFAGLALLFVLRDYLKAKFATSPDDRTPASPSPELPAVR